MGRGLSEKRKRETRELFYKVRDIELVAKQLKLKFDTVKNCVADMQESAGDSIENMAGGGKGELIEKQEIQAVKVPENTTEVDATDVTGGMECVAHSGQAERTENEGVEEIDGTEVSGDMVRGARVGKADVDDAAGVHGEEKKDAADGEEVRDENPETKGVAEQDGIEASGNTARGERAGKADVDGATGVHGEEKKDAADGEEVREENSETKGVAGQENSIEAVVSEMIAVILADLERKKKDKSITFAQLTSAVAMLIDKLGGVQKDRMAEAVERAWKEREDNK